MTNSNENVNNRERAGHPSDPAFEVEPIVDEVGRQAEERTTKRAETNEELQLQAELLDRLPVSAWTLKPDGTPDFVNRVWLEVTGQALDFVRSRPEAWMTAVHPEDRETVLRIFWHGVRSGQDFAMEARTLCAQDGTYRWHLHQAVVLRGAEGRVLKFVGTSTDIDDQKRAEEEVRANELRLREMAADLDRRVVQRTKELAEANEQLQLQAGLLQNLPLSAWTLKSDGTPDFVNRVWLEVAGQTLDFVRSNPEAWMTAVHPDDREIVTRAFWAGISQGQGFAMEARTLCAPDMIYRWHLHQAVVLRDAEGKVVKFVGTSTDIDDQKRAEEEVRGNERRLREMAADLDRRVAQRTRELAEANQELQLQVELLQRLPVSAWTLKPDGTPDFVNQVWLEFSGQTLDFIRSHPEAWMTAVHPEDREGTSKAFWGGVRSEHGFAMQSRTLRARDGVYRWHLHQAVVLRDTAGKVLKFVGTTTDIDDQKRAEEALRESEYESRLIVDSIPGLIAVLNASGEIERVSQPVSDYFGKSLEELRPWAVNDTIHPDDRPEYLRAFQRSFAAGDPFEFEVRIRRFDGVFRWFNMRGLPLLDRHGHIVRWYFLLTEVDERKQAEEKVRRSEAYLEEAQHLTRVGSFSWRVETNQITWSEQLYRIHEFTPGSPLTFELIGTRVHPDDIAVMNGIAEHARHAVSDFEYEYRLLMPDRTIKYLHSIAHATRDQKGKLEYIGAVQDVTHRHLAEEALTQSRTELAHVVRVTSLGVMTASIAHEVNQPLSGIITNASTCLRMLNVDPPNLEGARETARRTIRDGNRASDLVTRLRTLYSKKEPSLEPMDLNEAVREVIALLLSELQRNSILLQQELADCLPVVQGDRIQIQQVIHNLVRNASDAMSDVGDRPKRLAIRTERVDEKVCVIVQDSGTGFDSASADRLFESFYTTKPEGMGIGLSVSRSIIDAHGGRLWAAANDGPGATFAFSVPCG
jgi:PAS domain S-box-containing protein